MAVVPESGPPGGRMLMGITGSIRHSPSATAAGLPALWAGFRPGRTASPLLPG